MNKQNSKATKNKRKGLIVLTAAIILLLLVVGLCLLNDIYMLELLPGNPDRLDLKIFIQSSVFAAQS